jgi:CubicO group peptidase (beta-lactamase class C family)
MLYTTIMKNYLKLTTTLLMTILFLGCGKELQNDVIVKNTLIDSLMTFCNENGMFNGTILVSENGTITYKNALGMADKDNSAPLTTDTHFYLASVSKQFTTMAVMILKEQGALTYEDKLSDFFPEFPAYAEDITLRHMMNHTSGIPDHYGLNAYKKGLTNDDVFELLVQQEKLDFNPGDRYSYSNGGYVLLSMIVEKVSGMPFHDFMNQHIFDPLQMSHTLVYDKSGPTVKNRAVGFNSMDVKDDYEIFTTGAGGMYSCIDDLFKWDQALYTEKLVSKETLNEAFSPVILNNGETSNYGFGWGLNRSDGKLVVGHSGGMNGFRTFLRRYVDDGTAYVLLTNNGDGVAMGQINQGLDHILKGKEFNLPMIPIANKMKKMIQEEGVTKAIEKIKVILNENSDQVILEEGQLNAIGYELLNSKKIDEALSIFEFNIELNPNASNPYDSYGEGLLIKGDTLNSIKNYKKSVHLNPNNTNGIDVLNGLGLTAEEIMPQIEIPISQLESYTGTYQLDMGLKLTISNEGNRMFIFPSGQSKSEIFPASETRFYSKIVNAQITFNIDEDGSVSSFTLHQNGDNIAKRIE